MLMEVTSRQIVALLFVVLLKRHSLRPTVDKTGTNHSDLKDSGANKTHILLYSRQGRGPTLAFI